MRATLHRWKLATLCIGSLAALAACGDDSTGSGTDNDVLLFPDAVFDGFTPDTQQPTDTLTTTDTSDTQQPTDTRDATPPDLTPDVTPPQVVSTNPADGANNVALPLTITITFNEPLDPFKVAAETFKLLDVNGVGVPGTPTLSTDGLTVTWKPTTNDQSYATPYTIEVSGLVTDLAGNRIDNPLHFSFTTANYPNQDAYRDLAIKYAPTVKSSVELTGAGQPQVPTKLDADGDWNLANNKEWLVQQATSLVPAVYFTVAETRTHYFIHYMLYFPWVNRTGASEHANGTVVYMVTVEKARGATVERPVALHTWFREGTSEENFAFLTTESGIVRSGDDAKDWYAQAELAQDSLFPGGHFTAWVTATNHYACVWGQSVGNYCQWGSTVENGNTLVFAYTNGSPTPYAKENNAWPKTMSDIAGTPESLGYALIPALTSLWPRRFEKGDLRRDDAARAVRAGRRPHGRRGARAAVEVPAADRVGGVVLRAPDLDHRLQPGHRHGVRPAEGALRRGRARHRPGVVRVGAPPLDRARQQPRRVQRVDGPRLLGRLLLQRRRRNRPAHGRPRLPAVARR